MKVFSVLGLIWCLSVVPSFADGFEGELGFSKVSVSDADIDLSFDSLYAMGGYRWYHNSRYSSSAEVLLGVGSNTKDLPDSTVTLSSIVGVGYKGMWRTRSDNMQLFWRASYSQISLNATGFGIDDSGYAEDPALGIGFVYRFISVGYTTYFGDLNSFHSISIGYKF